MNLVLTFASIILGLIGAAFGTFPSAYTNTIGRRGKLSEAEEALYTVRQKGELSDPRLIGALLDTVGIPSSDIVKIRAHGGVLFGTTRALNEWISLYDANDKQVPNLNLDPHGIESLFRQVREGRRNRWAFGFIALAYLVQVASVIA